MREALFNLLVRRIRLFTIVAIVGMTWLIAAHGLSLEAAKILAGVVGAIILLFVLAAFLRRPGPRPEV